MSRRLKLNRQIIGLGTHGEFADFNPRNHTREEMMLRVSTARSSFLSVRPHILFAPVAAFTNHVVRIGEDDDVWRRNPILVPDEEGGTETWSEEVMIRTNNPADGGIVNGPMIGVAFFNADCPIIALIQDEKLAVLHGGYRTLIREDNREPNIIEVAIQEFEPEKTRAWVGFGIGPCCWVPEYEEKPEIGTPSMSRHAVFLEESLRKTTDKCPFGSGYQTIDLLVLAHAMLTKAGIPANYVQLDRRCTCCAKRADGQPLFWSHNRYQAGHQDKDGRNMSVFFLDPRLETDGF